MRTRRAQRRERAEDELGFSRIVAFSDGVFAIGITLLVLQLEVPAGAHSSSELWHELKNESGDLLAYGISFAVIGRLWVTHHRFFSVVKSFDSGLLALNIFYLALVVLVAFTSQILGEYGDLSVSVVLYAVNLVLVLGVSALMATFVLRRDHLLPGTAEEIRAGRDASLWAAGVFLFSIPVAFLNPAAGMYFWLLNIADPTQRRYRGDGDTGDESAAGGSGA